MQLVVRRGGAFRTLSWGLYMPEIVNFAQDFINAFTQGQQVKTRKREEQEAEEDRDIEKKLLQHRLREMKIQTQLQARTAAKENYSMLENQPENTFRNATDEDMGRAQMGGIPGQIGPEGMVPVRKPTMQIPGVDELGVSGISMTPQTREENLAEVMTQLRMRARNMPQSASRGEVITLASDTPGQPPEVLATGQAFPEPMVNYTTRDAQGVETTERIPQSVANERGPAVKQPLPRRPSTSGQVSDDVVNDNVEMIINGDSSVLDLTGSTSNVLRIKQGLKNAGFDLKRMQDEERKTRAKLQLSTRGDIIKISTVADGAAAALEEIKTANASNDKATLDAAIAGFKSNVASLINLTGGSDAVNKDLINISDFFSRSLFSSPIDSQILMAEKALTYRTAGIKAALAGLEKVGWEPNDATAGAGAGGAIEYEITLPDGTKQKRKIGQQ